METGENNSASVPMMTEKGSESSKPLKQAVPNQATPSSFVPLIASPHATGEQSAMRQQNQTLGPYQRLCFIPINSVEELMSIISRDDKLRKSNYCMNTSNDSGRKQSSDKVEEKAQPTEYKSTLPKDYLKFFTEQAIAAKKRYANQEASYGLSVIPESTVVRNTVSSVSSILSGERIADLPIKDENEQETWNIEAASRRGIWQKGEIQQMCEADEFAEFEAQNLDWEDDIPSESPSSDDESADTSSETEVGSN